MELMSKVILQVKSWQRLCEILKVMDNIAVTPTSGDVPPKEEEQPAACSGAKFKMFNLPPGISPYEYQVAGHGLTDSKNDIGMLHTKDGYLLKPMQRHEKHVREAKFYEEIQTAQDHESVQLRGFIPKYLGTEVYDIGGKDVNVIIMENITKGFVEPCIMDVKMGRQTWDPESPYWKIQLEAQKYVSKQEVGFCIPGFQVYSIAKGKMIKHGKEYGRKIDRHAVLETLKLFLNADSGVSREMLLQILAHLWQILLWFKTQKKFRFFSSSILLAYDARRLRQCLKSEGYSPSRPLSPILDQARNVSSLPLCSAYGYRTCSPASLSYSDHLSPNKDMTDGRLSPKPPVVRSASGGHVVDYNNPMYSVEDSWHAEFEMACRTHSLVNNYERDLKSIKENYTFQLDDLKVADKPDNTDEWVKVKMIDFAHVFPAVNDELDTNYLEGLENFVKMIENIMHESQISRM